MLIFFTFVYIFNTEQNTVSHFKDNIYYIYIILLITYKLIKKNIFYNICVQKNFLDKYLKNDRIIYDYNRSIDVYTKSIVLKRKLFERNDLNEQLKLRMTFIERVVSFGIYK